MKLEREKSSPCRYADERSLGPLQGHFPHYHRMPILSIVVGAGSSQKRVKLLTKMRVVVLLLRSSLLLFSTVRTKKVEEVVSRPWKIPHPLSTAIKQGCQKLRAAAFATLKATAIHQSYIKAVPKGGRFVVCKCKKPSRHSSSRRCIHWEYYLISKIQKTCNIVRSWC